MGNYTGKTWQMKNYKRILKKKIEGKTSSKTCEIIEAKHGKWKNC